MHEVQEGGTWLQGSLARRTPLQVESTHREGDLGMHLLGPRVGFAAPSCFRGAVTLQTVGCAEGKREMTETAKAAAVAAAPAPAAAQLAARASCRSFPLVSKAPLAHSGFGHARRARSWFWARIGPEGADVTRLLGALLGGDDAPSTAREQLSWEVECAGGGFGEQCWRAGVVN